MVAAISVEQMQKIDQAAIENLGIPRLLLMEHAGLAIAKAVVDLSPRSEDPSVSDQSLFICCGTGYNGGDGLAAARHLHNWGYDLRIAILGKIGQLREEPAIYAYILRQLGLSLLECPSLEALSNLEDVWNTCSLIVDALLGIGVRGNVREPITSLIHRMNRSGKPIVAVDIPSGLNADTGLPQGCAVNANLTVTFGLPKKGCLIQQGPAHTGKLQVDSITIPRYLLAEAKIS